jgi:hypothetical protein
MGRMPWQRRVQTNKRLQASAAHACHMALPRMALQMHECLQQAIKKEE